MSGLPARAENILRKIKERRLSKAKASRVLNVSRKTIYKWLQLLDEGEVKDKRDLRINRNKYKKDILRIVSTKPNLGPEKISNELQKRGIALSNRSVWLNLKDLNLQTEEKRLDYADRFRIPIQAKDSGFPGHLRLEAQARKRMVEEVLLADKKVGKVIKEYGVSRKTFAKWKKRYQKASEEGRDILQSLSDQHPEGSLHPKGAGERKINAVLGQVAVNPKLSSQKIASRLGFIGNHGVQNILKRNNLNHYQMRLAYARDLSEKVIPTPIPAEDRKKHVLEDFIPSLAPVPPPTRPGFFRAGVRFFKYFFFSSLFTLLISSAGIYWVRVLEPFPPSVKAGLVFATIALFMGSVFFLYSLKYYLTLAIVLSFSQVEQGEGLFAKGKRKGVFSWLLGNGGAGLRPKRASGPVGLTPNLENVTLKRQPYVSIHIPFFNEKKVVERAITAATNFDYPEYEVILCDDSTDETTEIIRKYISSTGGTSRTSKGEGWVLTEAEVKPGVTLKHLHRTSRSGYKGGALRLALKLCDPRTEFISVFDADFVPYPDTLELFLKYFQETAGSLDFKKANSLQATDYSKDKAVDGSQKAVSNIAAVQGYQWHVLNKSENWITRGVRSEYAGSYVIERSGTEIYSGLKQISGAVYMIRRDVLEEVGWETSITEDFQLTLKLYEKGYKVVYTPYIQAPAECVSTLKRLIRQRMRWAEGHSNNVRRMFIRLMFGNYESRIMNNGVQRKTFKPSPLTFPEKLEFLYLSPYYLQAFFFLVGTTSWLISETLFPAQLPFWTSLWGWSLVLTNFISLPLMNSVGMFLEESEERDYQGLISFVALAYILVPFQAYSSIKGLIQKEEGPWFRTPKTGHITDVFQRGRFYRFISGILPGRTGVRQALGTRGQGIVANSLIPKPYTLKPNTYLALTTANNQFNSFNVRPRRKRWVGKAVLSFLLALSVTVYSMTKGVPDVEATQYTDPFYLYDDVDTIFTTGGEDSYLLQNTTTPDGINTTAATIQFGKSDTPSSGWKQFRPGATNSAAFETAGNCTAGSADGDGWVWETAFLQGGTIASGTWTFYFRETDDKTNPAGHLDVCAWSVAVSGGSISPQALLFDTSDHTWDTTDRWNATVDNYSATTDSVGPFTFNLNEYLYVEFYAHLTVIAGGSGTTRNQSIATGDVTESEDPRFTTPTVTIPESALIFLAATPLIPYLVNLWLKKRKDLAYA